MPDSYLVVGETILARRVCSALRERGNRVAHQFKPTDGDLRLTITGDLRGAAVLVHDDVLALRYALAIAHISPDTHLLVTIFDRTIADHLAQMLPQCDVTTPADLAAPALAGPCLDPNLIAAQQVGAQMLETRAENGRLQNSLVQLPRPAWWRRVLTSVTGLLGSHDLGTYMLLAGLTGLFAVLVADWLWLVIALHLPPLHAFNEAVRVVTTVGPATDTHGSSPYALFASVAMLVTVIFTAMFTAGVVDRILGRRLVGLIGRRVLPRSGHVVVVGLGQVGLRLCLELQALRVPVVGIERDPEAKNLRLVRSLNIPTIVGHGGDRGILKRVGVKRAMALAAVGSDDLDNVAVALAAQRVSPSIRLVIRAGEHEAIAETRSLLRLGAICDVTSLSAMYVAASMLGHKPKRVLSDRNHFYVERAAADPATSSYTKIPVSEIIDCRP
ncbi:NAD-binding protein [Williamsia muralis]|uniref:Portal protein n=1 Tax=Williamsia marianensis TaxID=85044 RepID=A0A2G3PK07_WILMA|nr:NAD-binding protein [Williamsia marianensis]PHV66158.1 portal protein [Williamsia marianensis]